MLSTFLFLSGIPVTFLFFYFVFTTTETGGERNKREPEYYIVKKGGNWFPIKNIEKYGYLFYQNGIGGPKWDYSEFPDVIFDYDEIHSLRSKSKAILEIEKLENETIVEIEGEPIINEGDEQFYFERENRDIGDIEDYESLDDYMEAQFGRRKELDDIKLGAERDLAKRDESDKNLEFLRAKARFETSGDVTRLDEWN